MNTTFHNRLTALGLVVASQAIALPQTDDVPEWIPAMPPGTFKGQDGRGPWTVTDPQAVIQASVVPGRPVPVDYNHQTVFAAQQGSGSPAAGWIDRMEVRGDGLIWAHVDWTPAGRKAMAEKEYRYVSPAFGRTEDGQVTHLASIALTNNPNLAELPAINSQGVQVDEFLKQLRAALGLSAEADQPAIVTAAKAAASHQATVTGIAALVGLKADAPAIEVASAVKAKIDTVAPDPAKFVPLAAFTELQAQVAELKGKQETNAAHAAVDTAMRAGKVSPALKEWALDYATKDAAGFEAWSKAAPAIVKPGEMPMSSKPEPCADSTDAEKEVCAALGISHDAFRKTKEAA